MGYTKYDISKLNDKENDIKRITENIDYIFDQFKQVNKSIDSEIKLRHNIYEQFNDLTRALDDLLEHTYNTGQIIDKAIIEYNNSEQQINNLFNQVADIATTCIDDVKNHTKSDKTNFNGIGFLQKLFSGVKNYFTSKIDHIKNFLSGNKIRINNKSYSKAVNDNTKNTYMNIDGLSLSGNRFNYNNPNRIKQIQQYIKNKGINLEVTGKLDRATLQASRMIGIDELIDNGFIQENSFRSEGLSLYTYLQNNPFMNMDPKFYDVGKTSYVQQFVDGYQNIADGKTSLTKSDEDGFDLFNFDTKEITRDTARSLIANPLFTFITQHPYLSECLTGLPISDIFYVAGFFMDDDEVYHTRPDCLQQYGGYNDFYDTVFDYATSMKKDNFKFSSEGRDYIVWVWKGDYLNLGAGAELGIYSHDSSILGIDISTPHDEHWLVDTSLSMPMTITLKHKGKTIISYDPSKDEDHTYEKVWWITGFNPYVPSVNASDLEATYTINFEGKETLFYDFAREYDKDVDKRWDFDYNKLSVTLNF